MPRLYGMLWPPSRIILIVGHSIWNAHECTCMNQEEEEWKQMLAEAPVPRWHTLPNMASPVALTPSLVTGCIFFSLKEVVEFLVSGSQGFGRFHLSIWISRSHSSVLLEKLFWNDALVGVVLSHLSPSSISRCAS